ncbi:MAG: hypothetical protein ACI8WA_001575 [Polaribacter sp.]|jgi:hypothetical protein
MKNLFYLLSMVLITLTISCNDDDNLINPTTQNPVDVYVAGQKNEQACYWKNNQLVMLDAGTFLGTESIKIIESSGDVYVLGRAYPSGGNNYGASLLWKNGVLTNLSALYFNQTLNNALIIDDLDVVGNDVYLVGYTKDWSTGEFSLKTWKNNIATDLLNNNTSNVFNKPCSIKFMNNNVYVTTPDAGIYVNTTFQSVTNGIELKGIAIKNNNEIYVYGSNSNTNSVYYKNLNTNVESNNSIIQNVEKLLFDGNEMHFSSLFNIYKNSILNYSIPQTDIIKTFSVLNDNLYTIEGSNSQILKINNVITMTTAADEVYTSLFIN